MQNNYDLIFDINDIKNKKALADKKYDELYKNVESFKKMIEETKEYYDTPSSKEFRIVSEHYIDIVTTYLNNVFKPYIDKLNNVINSYNELYNETNTSLGGGNSEV
jgi:hypothetical protein